MDKKRLNEANRLIHLIEEHEKALLCFVYDKNEYINDMREAAGEEKKEKKADDALMLIYQNLEDRMKTIMGTKVSIHNKDKNKGRIEIEYYSEAELERIVELIESIH